MLSLDTATSALSVALGTEDQLIGETTLIGARDHSVRIFPAIEALLDRVGWEISSLEGIVVGDGPGSYTGVRIGVTAAKTLAYALRIPVVGISTLLGMALASATFPGLICPMIDARRGRVYAGVYAATANDTAIGSDGVDGDALAEGTTNGMPPYREQVKGIDTGSGLHCLRTEGVYPMDWIVENVRLIRGSEQAPVLFLGEGVQRLRSVIEMTLGHCVQFADEMHAFPVRAGVLIGHGVRLIEAGNGGDGEALVPRYMQMVEAEAKLSHRE